MGIIPYIWEFTEFEKIKLLCGGVAYAGKVMEIRKKHEPVEIGYVYYPGDKQLHFNRYGMNPDFCMDDHYLVERIDNNDM